MWATWKEHEIPKPEIKFEYGDRTFLAQMCKHNVYTFSEQMYLTNPYVTTL